jgi:opacity protein-like surface antigen
VKRVLVSAFVVCCSSQAFAQTHELGFTIGRLGESDRGAVRSGSGVALQFNYGYRLWANSLASVSGEVHMLASPLRGVIGPVASTKDYASLYLTPGLRVKFNPDGRIQPYVVGGGGYALYEQSVLNTGGEPNAAPRHVHKGAWVYGGGADVVVRRWLALRFEVRDFVTGNPAYFAADLASGRQHNVVVGGGFVLRFGE